MFVRWKTKQLSARNGGKALYAVLVQSERRDGSPRQKVVKHLSSINERHTGIAEHQADFWRRAEQALGSLQLSPEILRGLESKLMEVVPRPGTGIPVACEGAAPAPAGPEFLAAITSIVDWDAEMLQLDGGGVLLKGVDGLFYQLQPEHFAQLRPLVRSRIRARITDCIIRRSSHHIRHAVEAAMHGQQRVARRLGEYPQRKEIGVHG